MAAIGCVGKQVLRQVARRQPQVAETFREETIADMTPASVSWGAGFLDFSLRRGAGFRLRYCIAEMTPIGRYCCKSRRGVTVEFKFETIESGRAYF
jgi:hypothetical protein